MHVEAVEVSALSFSLKYTHRFTKFGLNIHIGSDMRFTENV